MTANSSGLSLNFPAFLTTAAQSGHSHGNPTLALTNITGTTASNSAGLTLSLSAGGGGVTNQTGPNIADSAATITSGTVLFSNANGVSFGLAGSTMTASHNALTTAAQSDHSHGNPTLALTNLTGTTASASNGFTLSLSAAAPGGGGGGATLNYWSNVGAFQYGNTHIMLQSTFYVVPLVLEAAVDCDHLRYVINASFASTNFASTANTSIAFTQAFSRRWGLYTRGTGASVTKLYSISTGQDTASYSFAVSYGSASAVSQTQSGGLTWPNSSGGTQTTSWAGSTASSGIAVRSNVGVMASIVGLKFDYFPITGTLSAGNYWFAYNLSSTFTSAGVNATGARFNPGTALQTSTNVGINQLFGTTNSSNFAIYGLGSFTTVGGATTGEIPFSAISTSGTHPRPVIWLGKGL
jgi:hypothetical protein